MSCYKILHDTFQQLHRVNVSMEASLLDLQDQVEEESTLVGSFIFSGIKTVDFWDLIILMEIKKSTLLGLSCNDLMRNIYLNVDCRVFYSLDFQCDQKVKLAITLLMH